MTVCGKELRKTQVSQRNCMDDPVQASTDDTLEENKQALFRANSIHRKFSRTKKHSM
jgi:hypothetical protein